MRVLLPLKKTHASSSSDNSLNDDQQYASDSSFDSDDSSDDDGVENEEDDESLDSNADHDEVSEQEHQPIEQSKEVDSSVAATFVAEGRVGQPLRREVLVPSQRDTARASATVTAAAEIGPVSLASQEGNCLEEQQVEEAQFPSWSGRPEFDASPRTAKAEHKVVPAGTLVESAAQKTPLAYENPSSNYCDTHSLPGTVAAAAPALAVAAHPSPPTAALLETTVVASACSRPRKRRTPESQSADSKPSSRPTPNSSKKTRVRPANTADKKPAALKESSPYPVKSISNMAGGRRKISDNRRWPNSNSNSYCIDSNNSNSSHSLNASNNSNGRDDAPVNDDSAEMDVRFAYPRENNPASARGDTASAFRVRNCNFAAAVGRDDYEEVVLEEPARNNTAAEEGFAAALKKSGLEIVQQKGDGNCLFRAISLQVYGDATMHGEVRQRCLDFMERDQEHFSQFITDEPFDEYIRRKRRDGVHGNNPEIQAISELFNRPIEVFVPENGATPLNIFHAEYKTADAPIRLSYHDGNHYNAVIDPFLPTAGLGLGLPGLQPGLADKLQLAKAVAESDKMADQRDFERALKESQDDQLQRAIKESSLSVDNMYKNKAISLSDCDATNFELEQAVLESSLESFRNYEHGRKQASSNSSTSRGGREQVPTEQFASRNFPEARDAVQLSSAVASIPVESRQDARSRSPIPRAASLASASVAYAPASVFATRPDSNDDCAVDMMGTVEQYPQSVQELCMNGFEFRKVVHAYELIGDSFDDLLGFLMSTSAT